MRFIPFLRAAAFLGCSAFTALACAPDRNDPGASSVADPDAGPDGGLDAAGLACSLPTDCPQSFWCAFRTAEGCAARGACEPVGPSMGFCGPALVTVCACAGFDVSFCPPLDSVPFPVAHLGSCEAGVPPVEASADH